MIFPNQTNHCGTLYGGDALRMMGTSAAKSASRPKITGSSPCEIAIAALVSDPKVPVTVAPRRLAQRVANAPIRVDPSPSGSGGGSLTVNHAATHTNPSAPETRNAACHPNATASAGIASGVMSAPILGAVSPMPSAIDRSFCSNRWQRT